MTAEQTIAEPEASSHVKTYGDKGAPEGMYSEFVGENASYFAQAFAPLNEVFSNCLLYTSPSPRDKRQSRMPSSA